MAGGLAENRDPSIGPDALDGHAYVNFPAFLDRTLCHGAIMPAVVLRFRKWKQTREARSVGLSTVVVCLPKLDPITRTRERERVLVKPTGLAT